MGHSSLSKLQKMLPGLSKLSSIECESCQLGKHTRSSFPKKLNNRATFMFDVVHLDNWGPSRISTNLGFQYFGTFIDEYYRYTWLFLIKSISELFTIFQKFCAEI